MQKDGMDIELHTMTHAHLNHLSPAALNFQIGGSKECLASHGYNVTTFAYLYNEGSNNATVANVVARCKDANSNNGYEYYLYTKSLKPHIRNFH